MALFKCKMCGGNLEIAEGLVIAECEYCGTKQTVPKAMDENLRNLLNRANALRIKGEFDKAEALYEKLIQTDVTQSEAYWGLILCKYGIEYVDDPTTFKKIPTCHRASYDSIIADDDYKSALEHADTSQRALYEEQAREIDRIQKEILSLAQQEETYDVFICYKETDANGRRTPDSVIANDIYYQLTQEGFKVFYAAITLEEKLGSSYEPIIFAALNSAKVMLCIGTKQEHFNAVWVKNEWSRFLKIIQKDRSKLLIPCYRDMDAYELPEEFAHLQAQDMGKIGFINDLVRGIKKVIQKDKPKEAVVRETVVTTANDNTEPLLKRAVMFPKDGKPAGRKKSKIITNTIGIVILVVWALVFYIQRTSPNGALGRAVLTIKDSVREMSIEHVGADHYNFTLTNTSDLDFRYAELHITGYDANGVNVTSGYKNFTDWNAGTTITDSVHITGDFETATAQMILKSNKGDATFKEPIDIDVIDDLVIVLDLPALPKTVSYFGSSGTEYSHCNVTDITYEVDRWSSDGEATAYIYFSGEKTYDRDGNSYSRVCRFAWKLYDESGAVIDSDVCQTSECSVGEQFKDKREIVNNLAPGTYRLEILDDN